MSNTKILLETLIENERKELTPDLSSQEYFGIFSASMILKDRDLGYDELQSGIVDGGDDGGIDSVYTFIDNEYIFEEPADYSIYKRKVAVDIFIIQNKFSETFKENAVEKFNRTINDLLDIGFDKDKFKIEYNDQVIEKFELIGNCLRSLVTKFPRINIVCLYVTKGNSLDIHEKVKRKADRIIEDLTAKFDDSKQSFDFWGATELLKQARRQPQEVYKMTIVEGFSPEKGLFIALINLKEYYNFITNSDRQLEKNLFETNIRDYQGNVVVNKAIRVSLEDNRSENFWWLNNGVTILASKLTASGKEIVVETPQIVNGLQTSNEIYQYFYENYDKDENRSLLVRVICPKSEESRDKIIKATNSQTSIPSVSLRGSDKIHRDIEDYFKSKGLYYDRRKNYYKNEGKPIDKIVSLSFLGQSLMSILLQKPNVARARPSTLLNNEEEYQRLFSEENDLNGFYNCATLLRIVDNYLKKQEDISTSERSDLKYYVGLDVAYCILEAIPKWENMNTIDLSKVESVTIKSSFEKIQKKYHELGGNNKVAKGTDLIQWLLEKYNIRRIVSDQRQL